MSSRVTDALVFALFAIAYAVATWLIGRRFRTVERMTWHRFLDRWGLVFIFLPLIVLGFIPDHWLVDSKVRSGVFSAAYVTTGVITLISVVATIVQSRKEKSQLEAASRDF